MKTLNLIVSMVMLLLFSAQCQSKKDIDSKNYPIEITDNIKRVKKISWGYQFYLKKPQIIKTYPVKKWIRIDDKGELMMFHLSEDHLINGDLIPAGSKLRMFSVGRPFAYSLSKPTYIQGYQVSVKPITGIGYCVEFFNNGTIDKLMLEEDSIIMGFPCKGQERLSFYENGELHFCVLSKDFEYQGNKYDRNTYLFIDRTGKAFWFSGGYYGLGIGEFHETGCSKVLNLKNDAVLQGIPIKKSGKVVSIYLYPSGQIKSCLLSRDFIIEDIVYKKNTYLFFDTQGHVVKEEDIQ